MPFAMTVGYPRHHLSTGESGWPLSDTGRGTRGTSDLIQQCFPYSQKGLRQRLQEEASFKKGFEGGERRANVYNSCSQFSPFFTPHPPPPPRDSPIIASDPPYPPFLCMSSLNTLYQGKAGKPRARFSLYPLSKVLRDNP